MHGLQRIAKGGTYALTHEDVLVFCLRVLLTGALHFHYPALDGRIMPPFSLFELLDGMVKKVKFLPSLSRSHDTEGPVKVDIHDGVRCSIAYSNLRQSR